MSTGSREEQTSAFVAQLTGCQSTLYSFIVALLGSAENAGDILQETNIALWNKANDYDASKPFLPWAYTFARFQVMAWRKRQSRNRLVLDDELLAAVATKFETEGDQRECRTEALERCLSSLPEGQRGLLDARYVDGESVKSIASRMGKVENVISASLYRIRKSLMQCVRIRLAEEVEP
jgi:RNA polymerase sigma-70 factor (ECF subfamily)